ncbi:MAG: ecdysteroid 22-kinase family protein [Novosphingobium sp.]|nr:ecdysteroid 22-kinase family protein [Novosphingobium sp.]
MMATPVTIPLPRSPDGLTAEWLTAALQERYPGVEVTALRHGRTVGGTGTKIQLLPEYNAAGCAAGLPAALYAKGGFEWHEVAFANSYIAEAIFYADWAPRITANIPRCHYAGHDEGQGIVLIEDLGLRPATFGGGRVEPLDVDTVAQVVRLLAAIHAATWNAPGLGTLRTLGQRVGTNFIDHFLAPEYYAQCLSEPRGAFIPVEFHDPARMLAGLRANWAQAETGPQSFCHGDAHMGNLFFEADGTPGLLDFQAYVRTGPLHDVSYHVVGSLAPEERRAHERELLRLYLVELARLGVSGMWDEEEAWLRFRQHTMHGLLWFATPEAMQPAAIVAAHGERFGKAARDYGLAALLGV